VNFENFLSFFGVLAFDFTLIFRYPSSLGISQLAVQVTSLQKLYLAASPKVNIRSSNYQIVGTKNRG